MPVGVCTRVPGGARWVPHGCMTCLENHVVMHRIGQASLDMSDTAGQASLDTSDTAGLTHLTCLTRPISEMSFSYGKFDIL